MLGSLEDVKASVEGKKGGGSDDKHDRDMDSTVSGGDVNSKQVEAVQLAAQSQYICNNALWQQNNLPVLPGQPANPQTPFHGLPRTNCQH